MINAVTAPGVFSSCFSYVTAEDDNVMHSLPGSGVFRASIDSSKVSRMRSSHHCTKFASPVPSGRLARVGKI
ncbi:uncharacterized protein BJX67DRAFT_347084 [Aspergillus lucknowensis]|uniref:Uncharacterized protein n=1 Tax=Aspergillus lucknowensis TaxID=176173 RepID=A0ABR4M084_9EURO